MLCRLASPLRRLADPVTLSLLLLAILCNVNGGFSMIHKYTDAQLSGKFGYYGSHEMLVKQDSWAGNSESSIEAELTFYAKSVPSDGRVHVFLFPETLDYLVQMYYDYIQARDDCPDFRDPDIVQLRSSNVNTSLLLAYESFYYPSTVSSLNDAATIGKFTFKRTIPYSSKWSFFVTHCAANSGGRVTVTGQISFLNSYGHLDADQYPLYAFNGVGTGIFLLAVIGIYVALLIRFGATHTIQLFLPFNLGLALVQLMAKNGVYYYMNRRGAIAPLPTILVVCIWSGAFFAFSRLGLFLIASGFRIVYYRTSVAKIVIMTLFCVIYGVMVGLQTYFDLVKDPFQYLGPFVLSILIPFMNLSYFMWVSHALTQSTSMAQTSRSKLKIKIFDRMTMVFQVSCALLLIFTICQLLKLDMSGGKLWSIWWLFDVYIMLVYFGATISTMFIIRPRRSNHMLHYSEDGNVDPNAGAESEAERPQTTPVSPIENDLPNLIAGSILVNDPKTSSAASTTLSHDPPRTKRRKRKEEGASMELSLEETASRTELLTSGEHL